MNALWLALWLLVSAWLFTLDAFRTLQAGYGSWLAAGVVVAWWGLRRVEAGSWKLLAGVGLITAVVGTLALPAAFRTGFALAAAGCAIQLVAPRWRWLGRLSLALVLVGGLWAVQAAVVPIVYHLAARYHEVNWLTPVFGLVLRPFYPEMALSQATLFIPRDGEIYECVTTLERLGFLPAMLFAGGGAALLTALGAGVRRVLVFLLALVLYLPVRYGIMLGIEVSGDAARHYWDALPLALSFLPMVPLAWLIAPLRSSREPTRTTGPLRATGLVFAGAALLVAAAAYHDPGSHKQGRILIDEHHSDWEWTTDVFDTEWYGQRSGYNYYSLGQFMRFYYDVRTSHEPLTADLLADYDILFLKTPTTPYSEAEQEAIESWVRAGGGLLLVGDHTNVFGTSTYLNPIATRFGLRFRYDSTYDLPTMALSFYEPPKLFRHPAVLHLPLYLFATGCTLEAPLFSENVQLGYGLKAMHLDYSQVSFFPQNKAITNYLFGLFVQTGGVAHGKGRVLGYTDSTCFSNFFMFMPGKPELILGMLDWLNRRDRGRWLNVAFALIGIVALVLGMRGALPGARSGAMLLMGGVWGALLALWICDALARAAYPLPEPHTPPPTVAFEAEHSRFDLPVRALTGMPGRSLHTFFVWAQRLDLVPRLYPTLEEALREGDALVLVNPGPPFSTMELDSLVHFVRSGHHVLVLDDPRNDPSSTDEFTGLLTMVRDTTVVDSSTIETLDGRRVATARHAGLVRGGDPLLLVRGGPVATERQLEQGRVTLFMDSYAFTDQVLGTTAVRPDSAQRELYELEYWLLRRLMAADPDTVASPGQGEPIRVLRLTPPPR